jgi:hypothetical protein
MEYRSYQILVVTRKSIYFLAFWAYSLSFSLNLLACIIFLTFTKVYLCQRWGMAKHAEKSTTVLQEGVNEND